MHWRREWPGTSNESDGLCTTARGSSWWKSTKGIAGNVQATQVEGVCVTSVTARLVGTQQDEDVSAPGLLSIYMCYVSTLMR